MYLIRGKDEKAMTEELIQAVTQAMLPDLTDAQMEKLENVLYIQFHGKRVDTC